MSEWVDTWVRPTEATKVYLYTFAFKVLTKTTFIFMIFVPKKLFSDQTNNIENPAIIMQ